MTKPDQESSEPPNWGRSTVPTSYRSSRSSRIRDIRNSLNRQGILCSMRLLKRSRSTRRCGVTSPTWHSTAASAWTVNVRQYGKLPEVRQRCGNAVSGKPETYSTTGTEVMQPCCIKSFRERRNPSRSLTTITRRHQWRMKMRTATIIRLRIIRMIVGLLLR